MKLVNAHALCVICILFRDSQSLYFHGKVSS